MNILCDYKLISKVDILCGNLYTINVNIWIESEYIVEDT